MLVRLWNQGVNSVEVAEIGRSMKAEDRQLACLESTLVVVCAQAPSFIYHIEFRPFCELHRNLHAPPDFE